MTTFALATLGCKVNTYESQGYESALIERGYTEVSFKEKADIYIINTSICIDFCCWMLLTDGI